MHLLKYARFLSSSVTVKRKKKENSGVLFSYTCKAGKCFTAFVYCFFIDIDQLFYSNHTIF